MAEMVLLKYKKGSKVVNTVCPKCGRISKRMLSEEYSGRVENRLARAHTCPVCATIYYTCSSINKSKWSSAFTGYQKNNTQYNSKVKQEYIIQGNTGDNLVTTNSGDELIVANNTINTIESDETKREQTLTSKEIDLNAGKQEVNDKEVIREMISLSPKRIENQSIQFGSAKEVEGLDRKVERWKKELLDTSKRNKMINYRETKRVTLKILEPSAEELFNELNNDKTLTFQRPVNKDSDVRTYSILSLLETFNYSLPVQRGDIKADGTTLEREKTLKNLRSKAKLAQEEQGTNIMYLSFGFIYWKERNVASAQWLKSPLLLMPVSLGIKSINAPYTLTKYDDEIEVNPTLAYLFTEEYGINLPTFEYRNSNSFESYMRDIEEIVDRKGWKLTREVSLGLLSFLKISMYHDINNNREKIVNSPVLRAICGEPTAIEQLPVDEYIGFDQDNPVECHEVVDSDSSQAEAIRLSKTGVSFVMQGPPGTGKSQTITNIISEALADGKKVLFVSEKSAALNVVLKRLKEVKLDDFCLSLHNYKANKKEIIDNIGANLDLSHEYNDRNIMNDLVDLFQDRQYLNQYVNQLHKPIAPLGESIYMVYGKLLKLEKASTLEFKIKETTQMSRVEYASVLYAVTAFEKALHNLDGALTDNPWYKTTIKSSSQAFKKKMLKETGTIPDKIAALELAITTFNKLHHTNIRLDLKSSQEGINEIKELLNLPLFPYWWIDLDKQEAILLTAKEEKAEQEVYFNSLKECHCFFDDSVLNADLDSWKNEMEVVLSQLNKAGFSNDNYFEMNSSSLNINLELKEVISSLCEISEAYSYVSKVFGLRKNDSIKQIRVMARLFSLLNEIPQVIDQKWFVKKNNEMARKQLVESIKHSENLNMYVSSVREYWNDNVFGINAKELKWNFRNEYKWIYDESIRDMEECVNEVIKSYKDTLKIFNTIIDSYQMANEMFELNLSTNFRNIQLASNLLRIVKDAPYMEAPWFDARNNDEIQSLIEEASIHEIRIRDLTAKVLEDWEANTLSIDAEEMLGRFKTEYEGIFYKYRSNYRSDIKTMKLLSKHIGRRIENTHVVELLQSLKEIKNEKQWYEDNKDVLQRTFGNQFDGENTNWENIRKGVKYAAEIACLFPYANIPDSVINTIQNSFGNIPDFVKIRELADLLRSDRLEHCYESMSKMKLISNFSDDTLLDQLIFKHIEKFIIDCEEQKNNIIMLNSAVIGGRRICYKDISTLLINISAINIEKGWFSSMQDIHCELFGGKSYNEFSDWESIRIGLEFTQELVDLFNNSVPQKIAAYICNGNDTEVLFSNVSILTESSISEVCMKLIELANHIYSETVSISEGIIPLLQAYESATSTFIPIALEFTSYLKADTTIQNLVENIESAIAVRNCRDKILMKSTYLSSQFGNKYIGITTDWDLIIKDIYTIKDYFSKFEKNLSISLIENICNDDEKREKVKSDIKMINNLHNDVIEPLITFEGYFSADIELQTLGFTNLIERYNSCLNGFAELSKWLDFSEAMQDCNNMGLSSFTEAIVAKNNSIVDIKNTFEKGFYSQWVELAVADIPAVNIFRKRVHENRLDKFVSSDVKQFELAQKRIRGKIISAFPKKNQISKFDLEIRTLRHEMGKKRKVMPLRKLFHAIPNVLLTLKPCLMMSPLSVAYFLNANLYKFDMVIFDEASQIFPQDAIGTIFRAKQVVIAGDLKQLPPTNFFATSTGNNNDVFDDDSYDDEVFDSILEETANVLPTRTLLWHYRSKHEHLIAFSNQEIYRNELVTFPSSSEKDPDTGVEFVHVPEGYYEGSGKNCNILEARRIVQLVKDHFDKYPKRSLGIIAFSEKQQQAISLEIQRFREKNPRYEEFFAEGKDDEFFVKNLENVQGDERDTIFFSVGYAKTKEQKATHKPMAMRFGPLGVQGGERRLNVAITRAKLNIKLVSSIVPSDIDLGRTESEGIRMLRSYIEFAMNGEATLASTHVNVRDDDFIDSIANLLKEQGYKIRKYVGCSGYKIDIAIEHPSYEAHFVAGIECDGFSYASARTARDRDRLRKSVLTDMGWKLYRVWSTEWYKNPEIESSKLIDFVEKSICDSTLRLEALARKKQIEEANRIVVQEREMAERERVERLDYEDEIRKIAVEEQKQREKQNAVKEKVQQRVDKKSALEKSDRKYQAETEKHKNDKEQFDRFLRMDRTWIKIGVHINSKSFGLGTISQIDGNYIDIQFEKENKRFSYPDAFISGYLFRENQD